MEADRQAVQVGEFLECLGRRSGSGAGSAVRASVARRANSVRHWARLPGRHPPVAGEV
jgi:hypothetical protein